MRSPAADIGFDFVVVGICILLQFERLDMSIESFRDDLLANLSRPVARKVLTSFKSLLKVAKHVHGGASAPNAS